MAATLRVEGQVTRAHPECGNGITWSLELRRGSTRQYLAHGEARSAAPVMIGPFDKVRVQPGDLVSILVGPREGNHSCDLTTVDLRLTPTDATSQSWSLADDIAGSVLAGNPHPDFAGRANIWHFYTEPVRSEGTDTILPAGSLLARWQSAESQAEKQQLAEQLERLLTGPAPSTGADTPDAALYRQLTSLAGPLFAGVTARTTKSGTDNWGLDPKRFGKHPDGTADRRGKHLCPSALGDRSPSACRPGGQQRVRGHWNTGAGKGTGEGSVQLEVLSQRPEARASLLPAGTAVADTKGMWTSNNQTVSYSLPVITMQGGAAAKADGVRLSKSSAESSRPRSATRRSSRWTKS